jgi:hypothetical protein
MKRDVIYRLPPRVQVIPNPHYIFGGDTNYAPYTLLSLGPYPVGTYQIDSNTSFGGSYVVTETTDTTIRIHYTNTPGDYPVKTVDNIMDPNIYQYAYKPYAPPVILGNSSEKQFNNDIYDYNAAASSNNIIASSTLVSYLAGYIPNYLNPTRLPGTIYYPGQPYPGGVMQLYGSAVVYLKGLPGFPEESLIDPTGVGIIPRSQLASTKGRYLIVVHSVEGFIGEPSLSIYPNLPNDRNVSISYTVEGTPPPDIIEGYHDPMGVRVDITYDDLFHGTTGPGHSLIFPYLDTKPSLTQPLIIHLPHDANHGSMRFYSNSFNGSRFIPWDINTGISPVGNLLPVRAIPANFSSWADFTYS